MQARSNQPQHRSYSTGVGWVWLARLVEQTCEGSASEDHFANNQRGSLLQLTNQKFTRNVIRTMMALLLVESFAILMSIIDCKFPLTYCSLFHTHAICLTYVHDCHSSFYSHLRSSSWTGSDWSTASCCTYM